MEFLRLVLRPLLKLILLWRSRTPPRPQPRSLVKYSPAMCRMRASKPRRGLGFIEYQEPCGKRLRHILCEDQSAYVSAIKGFSIIEVIAERSNG